MYGEGSTIASACSDSERYIAHVAKHVGADSLLNYESMKSIIVHQFSYPDKYRLTVWSFLLQLPMNKEAYAVLATQDIHPDVANLSQTLPMKYSTVSTRLMRLMSALIYWHPPLAECDWLPTFVYPFLRLFTRDSIITFEVVATIIINWCSDWLSFIPNPPITLLSRIERIAKLSGGSAPLSLAWPALRSFFGEVATKEAAVILMDNILSATPSFIEYLVASYCLIKGDKIITESNVRDVIKTARRLYKRDIMNIHSGLSFTPLPKGYYPILPVVTKIPMWKSKELERVRAESEAHEKQKLLQDDITTETAKIERLRRNWIAERSILRQIEEEQMEEFRRRERENMMRENMKEEISLQFKREALRKRRIEEEEAISEWKNDISRVQKEMSVAVENRRSTWSKYAELQEEAAMLAKEEMELELNIMKKRDEARIQQMKEYQETMDRAALQEKEIIAQAIEKSQRHEDELNTLRSTLERARSLRLKEFKKSKE